MRFGGIILVMTLVVGACSSDPAPKEPDDPVTSTSTSPAVAVPTMPPQASEDSPEGAAAFVKYYVDVFNYAAATGDVDLLSQLSSPDCKGCQSYITLYKETYAAGGYFRGSDWALSDFEVSPADDQTYLFASVNSEAGTYKSSSESAPEAGNPEDSDLTFLVVRTSVGWRLQTLELQAA